MHAGRMMVRALVPALCVLGSAVQAATPPGAQAESTAGIHTGVVKVEGGELYYEEQGVGPVVVLLHGGLLDCRMWDEQFAVLAEHHRVIRYDARGHGRSSRIAGDYSHYGDLHSLLGALGVRKATLAGLSLGGRTAIDFALVHPEMVEALALVSPGISGWDFTKDTLLAEHQEGLRKAVEAKDLDACVEWFQRSWTDGRGRKPGDVSPAVRERVRAMARANLGANGQGRLLEVNAVPRVGELRVPTLLVLGESDMDSIHGIVALVADKVPGARKVVIPGAAHMVNMEKPAEVNRALVEFLGGPRPAGLPGKPSLTVLFDNTVARDTCAKGWGFAALVEGVGPTILFDTGAEEGIFQKNVDALGVDLARVDLAVISHDHGDHTGGLAVLLRKKPGVPVWVPASAAPAFQQVIRDKGGRVTTVGDSQVIAPGVLSTGDLGQAIHEQALVLDTPRGLVVVTGCAHPGIVSMVERARTVGGKDVWMVLGGFHLLQTPPADIARIVARLRELGVRRVGATHCTGDQAIQAFRAAFGADFVELGAGRRIDLAGR